MCVLVCWCASAILFDCFCACACAKAGRVFVFVTFAGYANILRGTLPKDMDSFASFAICLTIASAPGPATTLPMPCAPLWSLLLLKNFSCSLLYCLVVFSIARLLLAWLFIYLLFAKFIFGQVLKKRGKWQLRNLIELSLEKTCKWFPFCFSPWNCCTLKHVSNYSN